MPQIARPYGILIKQYFGDHPPAHFHVICGKDNALFNAETLEIHSGALSVRAKNLVVEWATLCQVTEGQTEDPGPRAAPTTMDIPRIAEVQPLEDHWLLVTFTNGKMKRYDLSPLLNDEVFAPLRDRALFTRVAVEQGGYAVAWNADIDLSEYELWQHGAEVPVASAD
jgi:hypothetical protein